MDDLDTRRERAAHNQSLFRAVNERIAELSRRYADALQANSYVCECLNNKCSETLELTHDEYEQLRQRANRFFVIPGHEDPAVEDIVAQTGWYLVVEKTGVGSGIAESLNPRKGERAT